MIPEGYMKDAQGNLVPEANIKPQHKVEDQLVLDLCAEAQALSDALARFRAKTLDETTAFRDLLADKYGVTKGGSGGNVTLRSFDGTMEAQIAVSDFIDFGPELQTAKKLIDACVMRWSDGANDNLKAIVLDAFQVNKQGRIDTARVLGLRRLEIDDGDWQMAMSAINDAVRVTRSKIYVRFYKRNPETGDRTAIPLSISAL